MGETTPKKSPWSLIKGPGNASNKTFYYFPIISNLLQKIKEQEALQDAIKRTLIQGLRATEKLDRIQMGAANSKTLWEISIAAGALYLCYQTHKYLIADEGNEKIYPIRGLKNIGSTCYLNAVLQALAACKFFTGWLAHKDDFQKLDFPPRILHFMQYKLLDYPIIAVLYRSILVINRVIGDKEEDTRLVLKIPKDIVRLLHSMDIDFVNNKEQDTFEFLQCILAILQEEATKSVRRRQRGTLECILDDDDASEVSGELISVSELDNDMPSSAAAAAGVLIPPVPNPHPRLSISESASMGSWDMVHDGKKAMNGIYSKRKMSSDNVPLPVAPIVPSFPFQGMSATVLQCLQCLNKAPVKFETFQALHLVIPNPTTVMPLFRLKLSVKYLIEELQKPVIVTQVDCQGCSKIQKKPTKSAFSKTMYFVRLPSTLCLHISQSEWRGNELTKRTEFVRYEDRMNVGSLKFWKESLGQEIPKFQVASSTERGAGDAPFSASNSNKPKEDAFYELRSLIAHSGDVETGHFITCRRVPETPDNIHGSRWIYASDEYMLPLSEKQMFQLKPYMLFYERSSVDEDNLN